MQDKLLNRNKFMWICFIGIVTSLGCAHQTKATKPRYIVSFNLLQDECNIADIVKDYTLRPFGNSSGGLFDYVLGSYSLVDAKKRRTDIFLLQYITEDPRFTSHMNCASDFAMVVASAGTYVPNFVNRFMIRQVGSTKLCRYSPPTSFDYIKYDTISVTKSCIHIRNKKTTFEVLPKPLIEVLDEQSIKLWKTINNKPNSKKDNGPIGWQPSSVAK